MDAGRMVEKGVDARAIDELARGRALLYDAARAYVAEIDSRPVYVGKESYEVAIALQIQAVARGADLDSVEVHLVMDAQRRSFMSTRHRKQYQG